MNKKKGRWILAIALLGLIVFTGGCSAGAQTARAIEKAPQPAPASTGTAAVSAQPAPVPAKAAADAKPGASYEAVAEGPVLNIRPECSVQPGRSASFLVSLEGIPVPGAAVTADYVDVGVTDEEGRIVIDVPFVQDITIRAEHDNLQGELGIDLSGTAPG